MWRNLMSAKTKYNDPTIATDPPGGKHHETDKGGRKLPTDRPVRKEASSKAKSVGARKVAKAER
jgi:hypothetical protein